MRLEHIGNYRLSQHLISTPEAEEYRAVQVEPDGSYVRHVYVSALKGEEHGGGSRSQRVARLREFRDYLTIPNSLPIIDVVDEGIPPQFDAVVVSQWRGGCSLARLIDSGRVLGLKLSLHVLRALSTSLTEAYRLAVSAQTPSLEGSVAADRVWIDRHARLTYHNPFIGPRARNADGETPLSGVASLQRLLEQLRTTWTTNGRKGRPQETPAPVDALLSMRRHEDEGEADFLSRFAKAVDEVADQSRVRRKAAILELGPFAQMFEREIEAEAHERSDTGATPPHEAPAEPSQPAPVSPSATPDSASTNVGGSSSSPSVSAESSQPDMVSAAQPHDVGSVTQAHAAEPESPPPSEREAQESLALFNSEDDIAQQTAPSLDRPLEPSPHVSPTPAPRRSRLGPTLAGVAALLVGVAAVSALLLARTPTSSAEPETAVLAQGALDLTGLQVMPADASVYLVLGPSTRLSEHPLVALGPGEHELEIRAEGHTSQRVTVTVAAGETARFVEPVVLAAESPSAPEAYLALDGLQLTPPDTRVLVDGDEVSTAEPLVLEPGPHTVRFTRDGYISRQRDVELEVGSTVELDDEIVLAPIPRPGAIAVRSTVAVAVFSDGGLLGTAPHTEQLEPGEHTLEFRHDTLSLEVTYDVAPNETVPVDLEVVRVNSEPFGDVAVRIDNNPPLAAGSTPGRILAPVGATLVFTHPDYAPREVRLAPGQTAVSVAFTEPSDR